MKDRYILPHYVWSNISKIIGEQHWPFQEFMRRKRATHISINRQSGTISLLHKKSGRYRLITKVYADIFDNCCLTKEYLLRKYPQTPQKGYWMVHESRNGEYNALYIWGCTEVGSE